MPKKWIVVLVCAGLASGSLQYQPAQMLLLPRITLRLENALPPDVALNVQNQISETPGSASGEHSNRKGGKDGLAQ